MKTDKPTTTASAPETRKMNLQSLRLASGDMANSIAIKCCITGRIERWSEAVKEGWFADLNGKPFEAYYSPEAISRIELSAKPEN